MSDQPSNHAQRPPVTDSPLFWLLLFALVALGAVIAVGPRYARRQGQLQQKWEARERIARQAAERPDDATISAPDEPVAPPDPPTLRPLLLVMVALVTILAIGLFVQRRPN